MKDGSRHIWLAAILLLVLGLAGCDRGDDASPPRLQANAPSVLLITLDTTRADRVGCYGYANAQTPVLDALAESGVRFENAFCQVPLTLPSHVSLLTGTYPATNGVRINGVAMKGAGIATLAEVFQDRGYRTGGFISALVLDSMFGLDRGFDTYDDDLGGGEAVERSGDKVCDAALSWLAEHAQRPFFAWVHLFDPHHRYEPPQPYLDLLADPYDGEIAFADAQVGRLVAWLEAANLRNRTLVVVAGDHGEALKEHGESQHGLFVYDVTMRVPLIFSFPASLPAGRVVRGNVGLVDVFPTILESLGWQPPSDLEGVSLVSMWQDEGRPSLPVYGESEYPRLGFAWAPLQALISGRWKYIEAPRPELYDRADDPQELVDLIAKKPAVAARMRGRLQAMIAGMVSRQGSATVPDPEVLQRLESLGYVAGSSASDVDDRTPGRDPKDMVAVYTDFEKGTGLLLNERYREAVAVMEPLVRQSPESDQFFVILGRAYLELGRVQEAEKAFKASLRLVPDNPRQLWRLGKALRRQGKLADAISHFEAALAVMPDFAVVHCSLGDALAKQGRNDEAMQHYQLAVSAAPNLGRAHSRLGVAYATRRQFARARDHLQRSVELEPDSPHALVNLGNVLLQLRQPAEGFELLRKALRFDPKYLPAHRSLVQALLLSGSPGEAIQALRRAHEALPGDNEMTLRLAWMLATASRNELRDPTEAVRLAREVCRAQAPAADCLLVLAAAHAGTGDFAQAVETAQHALSLADANGDVATAQRIQEHLRQYESGRPLRQ